jgi:hypothetical protein
VRKEGIRPELKTTILKEVIYLWQESLSCSLKIYLML